MEGAVNGISNRDGQFNSLKDQLNERDLQIEAMLNKMDLMKKTNDELNFKFLDA
jgi:hypothetical protein